MPNVPPAVVPAPTNPDTVPRSRSGKRSAIIVVSEACMEFRDAPANTQKNVIDHRVSICEEIINDVAPSSAPPTIHGVRRPHRVRVRSDSAPEIGVIVVLNTDVIANRMARLRALCAGSMAWIWLGSSTDNTPQYNASNTKNTVASENSSSQRCAPLTWAELATDDAGMARGGLLMLTTGTGRAQPQLRRHVCLLAARQHLGTTPGASRDLADHETVARRLRTEDRSEEH